MKKLTAEECRILINGLSGNRSIREDKYLAALEIALPVLEQQDKGNDGWVEWNGGSCPVKSTLFEVKFSDGSTSIDDDPEGWFWGRYGNGRDIIAYRVIKNDGSER